MGTAIARAPLAAMMANAILPLIFEERLIAAAWDRKGGNCDRSHPEKSEASHAPSSELCRERRLSNAVPNPGGQLHLSVLAPGRASPSSPVPPLDADRLASKVPLAYT
jgi:hypothetical protein